LNPLSAAMLRMEKALHEVSGMSAAWHGSGGTIWHHPDKLDRSVGAQQLAESVEWPGRVKDASFKSDRETHAVRQEALRERFATWAEFDIPDWAIQKRMETLEGY